jgi:hypothetical protein
MPKNYYSVFKANKSCMVAMMMMMVLESTKKECVLFKSKIMHNSHGGAITAYFMVDNYSTFVFIPVRIEREQQAG